MICAEPRIEAPDEWQVALDPYPEPEQDLTYWRQQWAVERAHERQRDRAERQRRQWLTGEEFALGAICADCDARCRRRPVDIEKCRRDAATTCEKAYERPAGWHADAAVCAKCEVRCRRQGPELPTEEG